MKKQGKDPEVPDSLRKKAEELLKSKQTKPGLTFSEADMLKLIHELEVHQIELEMQNEELVLAKEKAESAEEKYTELYDFAPSGYFTLSRQGKILEMNLRGAQMLGKGRSFLINSRFGLCIKEDSRIVFATFLEEIFQGKNKAACDVSFSCTDNNDLYVHLTGIISEKMEQCFITATDITERKKAEEELKRNLAKYKVLINTFPIAITLSDKEGNIIETNEKALELLGLQREEHLKRKLKGEEWKIIKTDGTIFPQDEYASVKALKENRLVENVEMGIVKSGDEITWLNVTAAPIPIEDFGVLIAYSDITRRRQMENALVEKEERMRLALKATNDVVWDWDIVNDLQQWNEAGEKIFGWKEIVENKVNADWWMQRIHPDDRKRVEDGFNAALQNNSDIHWHDEYRFRKTDGTFAEVLDRGHILRDNTGKPIRMIGAMLDITERRKAEKLIKENEHRFRTVADFTYDMEYWQLPDGRLNYISPSCERITGYTRNEFLSNPGLLAKIIHPDDLPTFIGHCKIENADNTDCFVREINLRIIKKDSEIKWIEHGCRAVFDDNNNYLGRRVSNRDITERKNAELALIHSELFANTIASSTPALLYLYDFEKKENIWSNDSHKRFFEEINKNAGGMQFADIIQLIHPDDIKSAVAHQSELTDAGSVSRFNTEIRIKCKDSWKWMTHVVKVFKTDNTGKPLQLLGALFDIDELKRTQQDLLSAKERAEESENFFRSLFENSPVGKSITGLDGSLKTNKAFSDMLGYSFEEFQAKNVKDITHPDDLQKSLDVIVTLLKGEEPVIHFEKRYIHKNSSVVYSEVVTALQKSRDGKPLFFITSVIDITERKHAEEEIKKAGLHYQALIEKAPDGIVLIDAQGNYRYISPAAKKMFGYSQADEISGNPADYTHPDDLQMVLSELEKIFGDPSYVPTLEYRFRDKLGQWHWLETTFSNLLADPSVESIVLNFHEITERKLMADTQTFLLQISNPGSDENFFESLAKYLSQCLDMEYVCIDLLEGDGLTARTLAIYNEGNFDPNVSYALKDTPCGEVVGNHICCYPQEVRSLFPNDAALEDIKAESYIGTTLWSFDGQPIGLIAVIGQKPMQNKELATSLLKLVSLRAAGKLEATQADEKVRDSEEKFRVLVESTTVAIYLTDLNGKCTYVNPKWCEMAQLSLKDAIGDGWVNGIYEDDRKIVFENWQKMIASDGNWGFEYRFGTPDKISWVYGTAKSFKNDSGQIVGFIGSNVDITERKLSEATFKDIIEKNPMSIQLLDMEGYPIQVNPAHTRLFGVEPPSNYSIFKDSQLLALGFSEFFERIKKGEVVYFPDSYYNVHDVDPSFPDSPVWVKALGFTLNDINGNPAMIVLMHENITERKNAEALLNDIIENNPMSIQVVDKEGHTIRGNPAFIQLFGTVPPPEFSIFEDLKSKSTELEKLVSKVKNGEIVHLPDVFFNAHDAVEKAPDIPLWIRALIFPLNDSIGKPERFVFMHENITESKIAEQELIKAKEHAEESDRLKSAFLANMSHEIRTPMNGILGFSELLKEPGLTGKQQQEYIRIIEKSGARMLNIINDIVDISKIEAGLMNVNIRETDINEKIDFINIFFKPQVEEKGMLFLSKKTLPAKEAIIRTDNEKVYSILTNLVKNAIKFSEEGSIEFGYERKGNDIEFFVKDTGIGIPKERQEAIFERFIQADISDKKARQGAGLGLAISKAYVEMLGGKIWVESEECIGSTFYFTLPYNAFFEEEKVAGKVVQPNDKGNQVNPEVSGLKILIAEDDETSELLITIEVGKFAEKVLKAGTGNEAVEVCLNNPDIDLILMDIQMPGINGYEATRQIRQFNKEVVIIAQTAYGLYGDREKAIEAGCNDYISKPINKNELMALIQKYFKK